MGWEENLWQPYRIYWISTLSLHIVYFAKILLVLQVNWLMFYDVYQISDVATDIIINRNADQRIPNTFTTHGGWIQNCSTVHDCKEKSPGIKGRSYFKIKRTCYLTMKWSDIRTLTPGEEMAFTARSKIHSHSQFFR